MEEVGAEWSTFYRRGSRFTVYHKHDHTASLESLKMEHHCWHCPLSHPSLLMRKQVNSVSTISSASSLPFNSNIKDFITHLMRIIIIIAKKPRQHIKKQKYYFAYKGPYSQIYGFSSSHIWMCELVNKKGWALKNWCLRTMVLEKTLESSLDSRSNCYC